MDISQRDVMLLFTMGLAVVSMSFVFPALGLSGSNVAESDIPELDVNQSQFDFSGDFPTAPGSPRSEELTYDTSASDNFNQIWLEGDTSGGVEVVLLPPSGGDPAHTRINDWDSGSVAGFTEFDFSSNGSTAIYDNDTTGYQIEFEALRIDDTAGYYEVRMTVRSDLQGSGGWLSNVPVLGSAIDVGVATAATLGWFVEIAIWAVVALFDVLLNAGTVAINVIIYFVTLMTWLTTTYTSIVAAAGSWVSVFVALPGIMLGAVLAKLVIIGLGMLPRT